jgi:hypothetical protein
VLDGAGCRWLARGVIEGQVVFGLEVDGRDGDVRLIIGIGPPPIVADHHPIWQVSCLDTDHLLRLP